MHLPANQWTCLTSQPIHATQMVVQSPNQMLFGLEPKIFVDRKIKPIDPIEIRHGLVSLQVNTVDVFFLCSVLLGVSLQSLELFGHSILFEDDVPGVPMFALSSGVPFGK